MKVFITGVAGFLGSHLAEHCLNKGFKVAGNDTLIGGDLSNLQGLDIEFYKVDCSDLEEMTKIMKGSDVLCHSAAFAHEGLSTVSPKLICENNVVGSVSTFTAAIKIMLKELSFVLLWQDMVEHKLHIVKIPNRNLWILMAYQK